MLAFLNHLLSENFVPHGHCYLWKAELVWLNVVSDSAIALAYYSIPMTLVYFTAKRNDTPFGWIFWLFSAFIIFCGTGHLLDIWTLWHPTYWLSTLVKILTAAVSLITALELVTLIPKLLALPSPTLLEETNRELEKQVCERNRINEELQESEARFVAFMSNSPAVAFIKDSTGNLVYINRQFEQVFDVELLKLKGLAQFDGLPKAIAQPLRTMDMAALASNQTLEVVETVRMPNGEDRDWLVLNFPIPDIPTEPLIGGIAFDITERRKMEEALRDNTAQLQQSLDFEAVLKRITDKVRDNVDEEHILQTAVRELGIGLGVRGCTAGLYNLAQRTSTISYEHTNSMFPKQGTVIKMGEHQEIYNQLLAGDYFQFCALELDPIYGRVATIACPIVDDQDVLGDLWLINDKDYLFRELELRVVQQVANQCAIAIRQARLFQASQAQVQELERLNHLKDDFLSTVSHELRTPMANIKMATQMLEVNLEKAGLLSSKNPQIVKYFNILHDEGQREIGLINDLLDLSRLEASDEPLLLSTIEQPKAWMLNIIKPFAERAHGQQQQFKIDISSELSAFTTDVSELEGILTELLTNAHKYTPQGEAIEISAYPNGETARAGMQLCIVNSGVELPEQEIDRIFDKFYRVPNNDPWKHGGTGLGLALVKKRVERLGATIQVSSSEQQTRFMMHLPTLAPLLS
ncbi:PAS domain S-box protein [Oculatella sp. LEGE 06141]|uniref:sensor histidine kinase n=1 Tax=Oculatella sp. LEGE 06141 TaxID=1828648 RepID=UPI001882F8E5|nr:ATP-binding protein [Oculatella sp. LEGE 06141]MBE9182813.1 PAS domain S-box protein [Oculatella sp. LEGE 06141]